MSIISSQKKKKRIEWNQWSVLRKISKGQNNIIQGTFNKAEIKSCSGKLKYGHRGNIYKTWMVSLDKLT